MPVETPYAPYPSFIIRFMDTDAKTDRNLWKAAVTDMLDKIRNIGLGKELMDSIKDSARTVYIQPALAQGNQCAAANRNCYVKLRQAWEGMAGDIKVELKDAFRRAEGSGYSVRGIAKRIHGYGAVTVETDKNILPVQNEPFMKREKKFGGGFKTKGGTDVWKETKLTVDRIEEMLNGLMDGSVKKLDFGFHRGGRFLAEDLFRAFYIPNPEVGTEFLVRGAGSNSTISFDPFKEQSCHNDVLVYRPPGIGLVHEIIHAWRNVNGLRYFKDKEKTTIAPTPDDEVMTTGFPPYQYEKFNENIFRGLWGKDEKWGKQQGQLRVNY